MLRIIQHFHIQDFRTCWGWLWGWIPVLNQARTNSMSQTATSGDRRQVKDIIHDLRLQATLAQLCYEQRSNNDRDRIEAQVLFAQADMLERQLMYYGLGS